eukprot:TRINITY_DN1524_c0_g2_i1.p1 TRINITY_DN1524_c0_g2~~TRINITY_DN1524_c0_g2_i1.p1  ORF type:complete len:1436 (-),score=391.35 TRINITY_DN1524_c0_g2_i1:38-4345(-)
MGDFTFHPSFEVLSEDDLSAGWNENARESLLGSFSRGVCSLSAEKEKEKDPTLLRKSLSECCWSVILGNFTSTAVVGFLSDAKKALETETMRIAFEDTLTDVLWVVDRLLPHDHDTPSSKNITTQDSKSAGRRRFVYFLQDLHQGGCLDKQKMKMHLDWHTLERCSVIPSAERSKRNQNVFRTCLQFVQKKYNVFREQNEGYGKLLVLLHRALFQQMSADALRSSLVSLIGALGLDPNRVLDVFLSVLEAFQPQGTTQVVLDVMKDLFPDSHVLPLVALRLYYLAEERKEFDENGESDGKGKGKGKGKGDTSSIAGVPTDSGGKISKGNDAEGPEVGEEKKKKWTTRLERTCKLIALLLHEEILKINDIEEYLFDGNKRELTKEHNSFVAEQSKLARKRAPPGTRPLPVVIPETPDYLKTSPFRILFHLLRMRSTASLMMFDRLWKLDPCMNHDIVHELLRCVEEQLSRFQSDHPLNVGAFVEDILPWIQCARFHVSRAPRMMVKLLHTLDGFVRNATFPREVRKLVPWVILPACALCDMPNPNLIGEIWSFLREIPPKDRYGFYAECEKHAMKSHFLLESSIGKARKGTKFFIDRLTKETKHLQGRIFLRWILSNPFVCSEQLLSHVELFSDRIEPLADALKLSSSKLMLDVLSYRLLLRFSNDSKPKVGEAFSTPQWLENLCTFTGFCARRNPSMDITQLLRFVVLRMNRGVSTELVLVPSLVRQLGGLENVQSVVREQMEAEGGGRTLRGMRGMFASLQRATDSSVSKLRDSLLPEIVAPLLILAGQHRRSGSDAATLTTKLEIADMNLHMEHITRTIVLLTQFLMENMSEQHYASLFPPVEELVLRYKLDIEVAFCLSRAAYTLPFLRGTHAEHQRVREKEQIVVASRTDLVATEEAALEETATSSGETNLKAYGDLGRLVPPGTSLSAQLFTLFWSLELYDIYVPEAIYKEAIGSFSHTSREKDRKIRSLSKEMADQKSRHDLLLSHLQAVADSLFLPDPENTREFVRHCIIRRATLSFVDAFYCSKFMELCLRQCIPNFKIVLMYDQLIGLVEPLLFLSSLEECRSFGIMLNDMFFIINDALSSEQVFNEKYAPLLGGWSLSQFCHMTLRWNETLLNAFLRSIREDKNHIVQRNGFYTLHIIAENFPVLSRTMNPILKALEDLSNCEREDVQSLAKGCVAKLTSTRQLPVIDRYPWEVDVGAGMDVETDATENARQERRGNGKRSANHLERGSTTRSAVSGERGKGPMNEGGEPPASKRRKMVDRDGEERSHERERSAGKSVERDRSHSRSHGRSGHSHSHSHASHGSSHGHGSTGSSHGHGHTHSRGRHDHVNDGGPSMTSSAALSVSGPVPAPPPPTSSSSTTTTTSSSSAPHPGFRPPPSRMQYTSARDPRSTSRERSPPERRQMSRRQNMDDRRRGWRGQPRFRR